MNEKNVAVVTEAGNGLGRKFAKILKDNHYEVVLAACSSSTSGTSSAASSLSSFSSGDILLKRGKQGFVNSDLFP